ncbi:hypothetical protein MPTK1_1g05570 [Marchantia polymorpha subsp. ruderalis]|uniref:Ferredoxin thioredoxin reductase alpha chain domain-containing protein n=2 Tax=Marchantia polymorpha TaxID=3197 RepID=A0AAF6ALV4_MARPO|nr:hypothetical protein MARPO_0005s0050 [Marchantia polymorpha]BBM97424.1 hypothetical protein Mp_1g05570 [Marchantia polymorpha subsp. ruderalis]|eukprot:PTQ48379.1 hypothetical protein MARPO_0005s0050 [Marchantia polymorpha]
MAMAMAAGGCLCSTSASCVLLQQQPQKSGIRSRGQAQGNFVAWSGRIQGPVPCSSSLLQRSTVQSERRAGRVVICHVATKIGDAQSSEGKETEIGPGSKIRVKESLVVYHVGKLPNLNLQGLEGEVKEHIVEWKGKTVSATFPYKVQFFKEVDGKQVKFFAHLRDDEFEVIQ